MRNIFLATLLSCTLLGCGYTSQTVLPGNIQTIYVDTVKNDIPIDRLSVYQPGLEMDLTNAIIRRLQVDGNLTVVEGQEADAVLETTLIAFEQEGVRFSRLESVQEFRLFVVVSMRLVNPTTQEVYWEEANFSGDTDYFVSNVRSLALSEATRRAINNLAKNIVDRIVEDW